MQYQNVAWPSLNSCVDMSAAALFFVVFFYLVSPFLGSRNSCFMPKVKCRKNSCLNRILSSTDTGVRKLEELLWDKRAIPEKSN